MTHHIILRGIPGSGKSTKAIELKKFYEKNGNRVAVYCRDKFRLAYLSHMGETENEEERYQCSFKDKELDTTIKEEFYDRLVDSLEFKNDIVIYDMTNISKEDCYFWFEFASYAKGKGDTLEIMTLVPKEGMKSVHHVPDDIMASYEKTKKENELKWNYLEEFIKSE